MKYFDAYTSNTVAGSGNQKFFCMDENEKRVGRVFYKITAGGTYQYSLLFSNIIDSTFSDGAISHKNLLCDEWYIHAARIGRCKAIDPSIPVTELVMADAGRTDIVVEDWRAITFGGQTKKTVMPGEFFCSDPTKLEFQKGEYLCLEMTFSGRMIPHHAESDLPAFIYQNGQWVFSREMPFVGMIGCDRPVVGRIAYVGDSITQGIGTPWNSYTHWNAVLSEKIGDDYAFWNLGLGYGRANDLAADGAWAYKAKQSDIVFVCYGVNDILRGRSAEQIKADLTSIVRTLKGLNKTVILQTVPPFDYLSGAAQKWAEVNAYIRDELVGMVDLLFDNVPLLGKGGEQAHMALYGGHPNSEGCAVLAEALYAQVKELLEQRRA
ncbi:MAG: SGNH/GDSL hydrolase family protein [Clostridia bacterium]|nr:SGNH/GDSL hydrolase family protein [Clostridia bacterium]